MERAAPGSVDRRDAGTSPGTRNPAWRAPRPRAMLAHDAAPRHLPHDRRTASPSPGPHPGCEPLDDDSRQPVEIDRRRIVREGGVVDVWIRTRGDPDAVAREIEAVDVEGEAVLRVRASLH
ncbi:MAG: hypothetical protein O9972_30820, partial [Burkholderiales bacterium]|nr:hypothetical protein [Burkholderiales bacterium]